MGARAVALTALALVACERTSAKYCELHGLSDPQNCGFLDAPRDTPMACTIDTQCAPGRCNTMTMQCVQCLSGSDCPSASPFCDPQTYTCGACVKNSDCTESAACLPSGQCAASSDVIYADGTLGADTNPCTKDMPCRTITHAQTMLNTSHTIIKLSGAFDEPVVFKTQTATLLADPGTTLTTSAGGGNSIAFMMTGSNIQIYDLEIQHSMKSAVVVAAGNTLALNRVKIHDCGDVAVTSAGALTLSRSRIYSNTAGGLVLSGAFQVSNNFIDHNGGDASNLGGVSIAMAGQSSFEFNTVADNDAKSGGANVGGLACTTTGFHAPNNIIARNKLMSDTTAASANVNMGMCDFTGSIIQIDVTNLAFVDPDTTFDYHIGSASTAKDASTVPSLITEDIDSQPRPYGPAKDVGADEYHP
jgi:hypothetical protein